MIYTFSEHESEYAYKTWGANCGPNALAFALQTKLEAVRPHIPGFDVKQYTSPAMMKAALDSLRRPFTVVPKPKRADMFCQRHVALVRIQWTGPWIIDGKPQKWAARQTHWICCWTDNEGFETVFDCNGGMMSPEWWQSEIVPAITKTIPRADGGWYPANVWRLK